jgi:predicted small metal-binding protein
MMSLHLTCIVDGCQQRLRAETEPELLDQVARHAAEVHGISDVPPDLLQQVRQAIREE